MRWIAIIFVGAACIGCGSHDKPMAAATKPAAKQLVGISSTDDCAMRMHDICGAILQYYVLHDALPPRADDLRNVPGFEVELSCPVSGKAYVYDAKGMAPKGSGGRVVLWDAEPVHEGMRWGILMTDAKGGVPSPEVIPLSPQQFNPQP